MNLTPSAGWKHVNLQSGLPITAARGQYEAAIDPTEKQASPANCAARRRSCWRRMRLRLRLRRLRTVHGTLFISGSICGAWRLAAWAALVLL